METIDEPSFYLSLFRYYGWFESVRRFERRSEIDSSGNDSSYIDDNDNLYLFSDNFLLCGDITLFSVLDLTCVLFFGGTIDGPMLRDK